MTENQLHRTTNEILNFILHLRSADLTASLAGPILFSAPYESKLYDQIKALLLRNLGQPK